MAVLRSIDYFPAFSNSSEFRLEAPPFTNGGVDGYITGISGTEFLPKTLLTTPLALGGSFVHGVQIHDREVSVTFKPARAPSSIRALVNRISYSTFTGYELGKIRFGLLDPDYSPNLFSVEAASEILDFENNSFTSSTESKITFKMPNPYFVGEPKTLSVSPMTFTSFDGFFVPVPNYSYIGKESEVYYKLEITLDVKSKDSFLGIRGTSSSSELTELEIVIPNDWYGQKKKVTVEKISATEHAVYSGREKVKSFGSLTSINLNAIVSDPAFGRTYNFYIAGPLVTDVKLTEIRQVLGGF